MEAERSAAHIGGDTEIIAEPRAPVVQLNRIGRSSKSEGSAQQRNDSQGVIDIREPQVQVDEEATNALSVALSLGIKDYKQVSPFAAKGALVEYVGSLSSEEATNFLVITSVFGDLIKRKYGCDCKPSRAWGETAEAREGPATPKCNGTCGEHLRRKIVSVGFGGLKAGRRTPEKSRLLSRESWDVGCSEQLATLAESNEPDYEDVDSVNPMDDMDREYEEEEQGGNINTADAVAIESVLEFLSDKTPECHEEQEEAPTIEKGRDEVLSEPRSEQLSEQAQRDRFYSEVLLRRKDEFMAQLKMEPREEGRGTPPPMEKAVQAYREGRLDEARSLFESIVNASPNDAHALYNAGMIALAVEDNLSAEFYFCRTLSVDPSHWEALWQYGVIFFNREEYMDAKGYISRCIDECPKHAEASFLLGSIWEKLDDVSRAVSSYENHLAHSEADTSSRVWLRKYVASLCVNELDDETRAIDHLMSAAELDQSFEVLSDLVAMLISMGVPAQAEKLLSEYGVKLSEEEKGELGVAIGLTYLSDMNITPGLDILSSSVLHLQRSQQKLAVLTYLADCFRLVDDMPQAELYLERCMRLAPSGKEDVLSFARVLHSRGKLKESCVILSSFFENTKESASEEDLGKAYADYAAVLLDRKLLIPASVNVKHAMERCPADEDVLKIALRVFLKVGKEAEAQRVMEDLIEKFSNKEAITVKSVHLAKSNQLDDARKLWESHITSTEKASKAAALRLGYSRFLLGCGRDSMASQQANLAHRACPHDPTFIFNMISVQKAIQNKSAPLPRGLSVS